MSNKIKSMFLDNLVVYFAIAILALVIVYYAFPDIKNRAMGSIENLKNHKKGSNKKSGSSSGSDSTKKDKNVIVLLDDKPEDCVKGCNKPTKNSDLHKLYMNYSEKRSNNKKYRKRSTGSTPIGPANIFIIRHGERLNTLVGLDCNGMRRSFQLTEVIEKMNDLNYSIDYIVTANPDLNDGSMHLEQTVMAASWIMDIPLFIFGNEKDTEVAVTNVYNNKIFNNKNVLFCWEHTCIQSLIGNILDIGPETKKIPNKAFIGANGQLALPYWGKNNYRTMIQIDEDFESTIYDTGIYTCQKVDDDLEFGVYQECKV